jgi:hypothetical protein
METATRKSAAPVEYADAIRIEPEERDWNLELSRESWPADTDAPPRWDKGDGYLQRVILADRSAQVACDLRESILRFPSAPIHSVQRIHEYHSKLPESLHFHTYRVLTRPDAKMPIERIYLFHNGLNELDRFGLYYKIASQLLEQDRSAACILRPFPSHLSRAPFPLRYAETPLQRYLWDGSQLFQQFLRYMAETQWFLSALVRRSRFPCLAGADLLAQKDMPEGSRLEDNILAEALVREFERMNKASGAAWKKAVEEQPRARPITEAPSREDLLRIVEASIRSVRELLHLGAYPPLGCTFNRGEKEPSIHVIGYSIGGFAAQSIFMSWPSVISSCSTLLSGGALRELSPTAFANPEEWQTVLHSLRYELDDWMLDHRFGARSNHIAGLTRDDFHYFQRTFYEVFQQEYHGSFGTRLTAFRKRMLFIVGGDDSIVRPQAVLASGPPGGINLLEIGGLGHFLGNQAEGEEREQQEFWVPEMGRVIKNFSKRSAKQQARERDWMWRVRASSDEERQTSRLRDQDILDLPSDGALPSGPFERCLNDVLARLESDRRNAERESESGSDERDAPRRVRSRLFISRNELPEVLLDERTLQDRARAFHHDEFSVMDYCDGGMRRRGVVAKNRQVVRVLLPWNARRILENLDPQHGFPSQSETAAGHRPRKERSGAIWRKFTKACSGEFTDVVAVFDGKDEITPEQSRMGERGRAFIDECRERSHEARLWVPSMPDCWIWCSPEFLGLGYEPEGANADQQFVEKVKSLFPSDKAEAARRLDDLSTALREEKLLAITISRARYNPRFRGRLVLDATTVRLLLNHMALCLAASWSYRDYVDGPGADEGEWV